MKKAYSIILCGIMSFGLLTGCGSNSATKGESSPASTAKSTQTNTTISVIVSGTKPASGEDFILDIFPREVAAAFPGVKVESMKLPDDQYYTSIKTKLATGQAPDMFMVWPRYAGAASVTAMSKAGYLADLSGLSIWDNIAKTAKDDMSYDGKPMAVTKGLDLLGTYYNKKIFTDNNLKVPTNWDEFLKVCEALKAKGITPIVMGDKDAYVMQFGLYQIAANIVYPNNMDFDTRLRAGSAKLTDEKWVKTINKYKELYDKGYVISNSLGIGNAQSIQTFIDGKAAMTFDGTFNSKALAVKGAVDFERGFFPLPANDASGTTYASAATGSGYAISATSKNLDLIKKIFNTMYDGNSKLFKAWRDSSTSISVFKGVPLQNPIFTDAMKTYSDGKSVYFCNQMWPGGTENMMEAKFGEMISGQKVTAEDVTKAMQAKFDELMNVK